MQDKLQKAVITITHDPATQEEDDITIDVVLNPSAKASDNILNIVAIAIAAITEGNDITAINGKATPA